MGRGGGVCGRVYLKLWAWLHTFTSQEFWFSSLKSTKFHALYDFFFLSLLHPPVCVCVCVWPVSENHWSRDWWKVPVRPPLSPFLFLRVSGYWIMKHDLRRLPGDHSERMQSVHSAACPSAPVHQGWCQVKTMAYWTGCACTLTGVNIDTIKGNITGTRGRFDGNTIAQKCFNHADL